MKPVLYVGIVLLIVIVVAAPLYTYLVADNIVTDAANRLYVDSDSPFPIHAGTTDVLYANNFLFRNEADIPLTLEHINITVYVTSYPSPTSQYVIGSLHATNQTLNAHREIGIPASLNVTSEDALSLIHSLNYGVGWEVETTASGSYFFWSFTKQKTATRP
jgi:hypothetical protein